MMQADALPYQNTYLIPILRVVPIKRRYVHPRGAICIVRYVAPPLREHRALADVP